jgi:hypothetical protein
MRLASDPSPLYQKLMRASQALFSLFAVGLGAVCLGCIPNPHKDYEEYLEASAGYRTTTSSDAAIDAKPPEMAVEQVYYVACLPALSAGDTRKVLRFYGETKYVPTGDGKGKLTLALTPIAIRDATTGDLLDTSALEFKKDTSLGLLQVTDAPVAADSRFTATFGTAMVPKVANALSFRDIVIDGTVLKGTFGSTTCGGLAGQIVMPIMQDLGAAEDNICAFRPVDPDAGAYTMPSLTADDFKCTL